KGKALQFLRGIGLEFAERSHGTAIRGAIEEARSDFRRHGKRKRVKVFAVLDVLVDVFDDVLGKGRSQDAAVAKSAMAEFSAPLEPSNDFVPREDVRHFSEELLFSGRILVDDFAVVENSFNCTGGEART